MRTYHTLSYLGHSAYKNAHVLENKAISKDVRGWGALYCLHFLYSGQLRHVMRTPNCKKNANRVQASKSIVSVASCDTDP